MQMTHIKLHNIQKNCKKHNAYFIVELESISKQLWYKNLKLTKLKKKLNVKTNFQRIITFDVINPNSIIKK